MCIYIYISQDLQSVLGRCMSNMAYLNILYLNIDPVRGLKMTVHSKLVIFRVCVNLLEHDLLDQWAISKTSFAMHVKICCRGFLYLFMFQNACKSLQNFSKCSLPSGLFGFVLLRGWQQFDQFDPLHLNCVRSFLADMILTPKM